MHSHFPLWINYCPSHIKRITYGCVARFRSGQILDFLNDMQCTALTLLLFFFLFILSFFLSFSFVLLLFHHHYHHRCRRLYVNTIRVATRTVINVYYLKFGRRLCFANINWMLYDNDVLYVEAHIFASHDAFFILLQLFTAFVMTRQNINPFAWCKKKSDDFSSLSVFKSVLYDIGPLHYWLFLWFYILFTATMIFFIK